MFKMIFICLFALFLTGCAGQPQVVVETKHKLVMPDDDQIVDCESTPPPSKDDYMAKVPVANIDPKIDANTAILIAALRSEEERSRKALAWGVAQTKNIAKCNTRLKGVRDLKVKAKQEIDAMDNKGK